MSSSPSTGSIHSPSLSQVIPAPGIRSGALMSSTDINPVPNIPNQRGTRPNICNRCWYRDNNPFLSPHLSTLALQLIPTNIGPNQISETDAGDTSISVRDQSPSSTDFNLPPPPFFQQTTRLLELYPTDAAAS